MTDDGPPVRTTRLYGAIDPADAYPPTIADDGAPSGAVAPVTPVGPVGGLRLERYRLGDMLGRGGMGEVVSARDEQIGRWVAIKRLRVQNPSPDILARFLREARIQGRLEHPAVVPVHELWTDEHGQPFFVMKQLTGTTLADVLTRLNKRDRETMEQFSRQRLLRAFAEVCLAIEFAHTRGVVHRDLKPANVVLGDFGEVYVLDWGIARVAADDDVQRSSFADIPTMAGTETSAGSILGTPGYISPEQIRGDLDLDGRADVYALGCLLFEILTLQPLHPRGQAAITTAIAGVDARASLRAPELDVPPELDELCVRATMSERELRLGTARMLSDAVQRYLDGNRDTAMRRERARFELSSAYAALSRGNGAAERRDALRAAARALALDPTDREPADLVGRLMLEPPTSMPAEVDVELERLDLQALKSSARFGLLAAIAYMLFFPLLYIVGFREPWYLITGPAICLAIIFTQVVIAPRNPYVSGYLAITGNLAMFALFGWMVSPIVVGPGPAVIMVTLLAAHRTLIRPWLLALLTTLATMTPWILELAGVLPASTTTVGNEITFHTAAGYLDQTATLVALAIYITAIVFLGGLLARLQDDERRRVRRAAQLQSWQLRQLVPRPSSLR